MCVFQRTDPSRRYAALLSDAVHIDRDHVRFLEAADVLDRHRRLDFLQYVLIFAVLRRSIRMLPIGSGKQVSDDGQFEAKENEYRSLA